MAKEVDEFLNQLNGENQDEFQEQSALDLFGENKKEEEKQEESKENQEEKGEEQALPFHKDPKIQRYVQREVQKALKELPPIEAVRATDKVENADSKDELVEAFEQIIGNDTPDKVRALKMLQQGLKDIENKALSGQRQIEAEREAEAEAERELGDGLVNIEETFEVDITSTTPQARKLRAEFIEFVETIAPKDKNGNVKDYPDFQSAFELFQKVNTKPSSTTTTKAKELASRSMARSSDASTTFKPQGNSWKDVEQFFSKLEEK